jgi:hypothetical protein
MENKEEPRTKERVLFGQTKNKEPGKPKISAGCRIGAGKGKAKRVNEGRPNEVQ